MRSSSCPFSRKSCLYEIIIINSNTRALGDLLTFFTTLLQPALSSTLPLQSRHEVNHHIVQPSCMGLSILLEKNLPLYINLSIRSFDILSTCPSHLTLYAFTNLTASHHFQFFYLRIVAYRLWGYVTTCATARQATDYNIIRHLCCAGCITEATNTHSEYVIIIAFPLQQCLQERAWMLPYSTLPVLLVLLTPCVC
jgi:hypothetical protein